LKEYDVKITETLEKTVTVQAESHDAAEEQVRAAYYNSEYILDSENFTGVAFGTTEEREVQKEQADTMNVLLVKPFMYPQAVQIGCELEDLQKAVGGDIEATYPFNEPVALVMHDEGKLVGKELNRALRDDDGDIYDIIAGDFLVVGLGEDDFCSLSPELCIWRRFGFNQKRVLPEPEPPIIRTFLFRALAGFFGRLLIISRSVFVRITLSSNFGAINGSISFAVPQRAEPYSTLCRYFFAFLPFR
jgi:hypothetical protein